VEGRFGLGSAISHEPTGFDARPSRTIRVCTICQKNSQDEIVGRTISFARRGV
jgi:hypothetical protein